MRMEEGLDTGPACMMERTPIGDDDTAGSVHDRLARLGADLMVRALGALERGGLTCAPQPEDGVTYADKIDKHEAAIDWRRPAAELHRHINGLSPFPGAWSAMPFGDDKERVKLLKARPAHGNGAAGAAGTILSLEPLVVACGDGAVELVELQRAGKRPTDAAAFVRGVRLSAGSVL